MRKLIILLILFSAASLKAQKDRYRFAETYFGFESEFSFESNEYLVSQKGNVFKEDLPTTITPRILIGGTHFWRKADFYVSIPLVNLKLNGGKNIKLSNDVFTGFRYLPFALENHTLRPFAGFGLNSKSLEIKNGPIYTNWQWFYEAGLNFRKNNRIIGFETRYFPQNSFISAFSRNDFQKIKTSPYSFSISYKFVFDATAGYSSESSKRFVKKIYDKAKQSNAYDAFSFGVGFNALIPTGKSDLASEQAFFNDEIDGNLSLDLGVGYYLSKMDAALRVSFRSLKQEETAFDYTYKLRRNSTAFEAFKFVGDYHGFAPFIGPYISFDHYHLNETDHGNTLNELKQFKLGYGLVFGWDIRQTAMDYLILRTNLRYTPQMKYKSNGLKFTSSQIEFNFIQIVFYPERYKIWKNN